MSQDLSYGICVRYFITYFYIQKNTTMKNRLTAYLFLLLVTLTILSCKKNSNDDPYGNAIIQIAKNEIVFNTENNNRIGYTLKIWEFEEDGLKLEKIQAIDGSNSNVLFELKASDIRRIYKEPIPTNEFLQWDVLDAYYISLQVPIPIDEKIPEFIFNRIFLKDTLNDITLSFDGGELIPRVEEKPIIISPPVKGDNLFFANQSTCKYHFDVLIFLDGGMYTPERFAFDEIQFNESLSSINSGDDTSNTSYYNYGDTLYAVADGTIIEVIDDRPENHGNMEDMVFNSDNEYAGNHLILKIDEEHYAFYCHIIPGGFLIEKGQSVIEGQPIALLGNSGNSSAPHLHFHIADNSDFWKSNGIPFVFKQYTKIGDLVNGPSSPMLVENAMMEENSIVNIDF